MQNSVCPGLVMKSESLFWRTLALTFLISFFLIFGKVLRAYRVSSTKIDLHPISINFGLTL